MNIKLLRTKSYPTHTSGQLYLEDEFFCFTVEDVVREIEGQPVEHWKIPGETAIPRGKYRLTFETSPRFGPDTITIQSVPGFKGIRIHAGNTHLDTEGCPIVGFRLLNGVVIPGTSKPALLELKRRLRAVKEEHWIQVI